MTGPDRGASSREDRLIKTKNAASPGVCTPRMLQTTGERLKPCVATANPTIRSSGSRTEDGGSRFSVNASAPIGIWRMPAINCWSSRDSANNSAKRSPARRDAPNEKAGLTARLDVLAREQESTRQRLLADPPTRHRPSVRCHPRGIHI